MRKDIKATPICRSSFDQVVPIASRVEYFGIQVRINQLNVGVVVLCNPSCSNQLFAQNYEKLLIELLDFKLDRIFIVGDFNVNVAASVPSGNLMALRQINATFHLTILPTGPTRITETSSTTIDLLITDCPQSIMKSKTITANSISDHEVVYLLADIRVQKPAQQTIAVRNLRNIDVLRLQVDLQGSDFRQFYQSNDVDTKTTLLTSELKRLLDAHAPERIVPVRDERTPWMTTCCGGERSGF